MDFKWSVLIEALQEYQNSVLTGLISFQEVREIRQK